ncbi:uncharacterized protein LOC128263873 [Drosophila gunungcola]|uniref:uncharacterized protein LOC128263873 n=1 Tax=Drosophila gunungcola TaxID=103775 RepID=UPI0022E4E7CE|nr:uncharacterized protein LOC128263873 [Drosophila gunungcola]
MVGKILHEFCFELYRVFAPIYLPREFLTQEKVEECVRGFEAHGFRQCFGAIDGSHIEIRPAAAEAIDYYNYKRWYSTFLFALVDYRYRFLYVNVGCSGRCHDSQVYESSALKSILDNTDLFRANSKRINETDVPVVLLGDSAFRFSTTLMKPYPFSVAATEDEKAFNYDWKGP